MPRQSTHGAASAAHLSSPSDVAALQAQIASLEAQLNAQRRLPHPGDRLNMLLAVSAALLVTHERDALLDLLVQRTPSLFTGIGGALLYMFDPEGHLHLRASAAGPVPSLSLVPGQGPEGRGFLAPRAMLMVGPELEHALGELAHEQQMYYEQVLPSWPPLCALVVPLRAEGQRLGVLALYGGMHAQTLLPHDIPFAQAMADLGAVAILEALNNERTAKLQNDLLQTRSLHAEAEARLNTAQAQLLQSAKLAAVGELAASVAHEINNPLYAARNSLYLVEQDLPPDAPQRMFLDIAQNELGRIAKIITRMRDFYRPARVELDQTNINDLVRQTIELVHTHLRHGHVEAFTALDPAVPSIIAHADQLRQVLLNLMLNSCDAMPNGGTLNVSTQLEATTAQQVLIQVTDTGEGIGPEHLLRLFEPFYTTKPQGTGLGLAISAHIVTQHGGQITVDSTPGHGTTFSVRLPVEHDA